MKKIILLVILLLVVIIFTAGAVLFNFNNSNNKVISINNFEECAAAGYLIMESYPERCKTPDGRTFIRVISLENASFDNPAILSVAERVKFDDGLQVTLTKINDSRCKEGMVCVWAGELSPEFSVTGGNMAESVREFTLGTETKNITSINGYIFTLNETAETSATITVSEENNQTVCTTEVKICPDGSAVGRTGPDCAFAECPQNPQGACYIGGCSGQICSDEKDVITTCKYREEYACYKNAKCERQANGQCEWTQTPEIKACLGK